jgi:hypothetical protein
MRAELKVGPEGRPRRRCPCGGFCQVRRKAGRFNGYYPRCSACRRGTRPIARWEKDLLTAMERSA